MKHYPVTISLLLGGSFILSAEEKPNIIIIYTDDMAYADLSCYGGNYAETENIDRLAEEGIRFTQYYTVAPISSPSRVGLLTGMYPTRWGIRSFLQTREGNQKNNQNDYLSERAPSLARTLRENGYTTAHFGKWHMGGGRDVDNAPSIKNYSMSMHLPGKVLIRIKQLRHQTGYGVTLIVLNGGIEPLTLLTKHLIS